jgi:hypothetical protein
LIATCRIDSLGELAYLDVSEDVDAIIKGVTNPGVTVTTGEGTSRVTSRNNGIPVSIRAGVNLKLCVYYLKLPMQSTWFWSAVIRINNAMRLVSRRLLKNLNQ